MHLYAEPKQLAEQVSALLTDPASSSAALLQLALHCLQSGHPTLADRLGGSGRLSSAHRAELEALNAIDLLSLYSSWKAAASTGWQAALMPDGLLRLGLLLSRSQGDAMARLRSDLQEVFGEEIVKADRAQALQIWDQLCCRCPDWSWARLMACDLALQEQQLELCHHHIEAAPAAERRSISLLDVEARLRLQQEFVQEALRCWDAAIEQARTEGQFKWAIALVRRRHAANMAHLKVMSSKAIAYEFAEKPPEEACFSLLRADHAPFGVVDRGSAAWNARFQLFFPLGLPGALSSGHTSGQPAVHAPAIAGLSRLPRRIRL